VIEPVKTVHVGCITVMEGAAIVGQMMDTEGVHVPVPSGEVTVKV
jgi:hypothetical protein